MDNYLSTVPSLNTCFQNILRKMLFFNQALLKATIVSFPLSHLIGTQHKHHERSSSVFLLLKR